MRVKFVLAFTAEHDFLLNDTSHLKIGDCEAQIQLSKAFPAQ